MDYVQNDVCIKVVELYNIKKTGGIEFLLLVTHKPAYI